MSEFGRGGSSNPYDEFPYECHPVEWTAPERLAVASMLHGGPRQRLDRFRLLELGCGDGGNLLPMAYYRPNGEYVGIDGSRVHMRLAEAARADLQLSNVELWQCDFRVADTNLSGQFDYILMHGVFSWVPEDVRDCLLELCTKRLRPGGLLYLNYNARPGWSVRGIVRDVLCARTAGIGDRRLRVHVARAVAKELSETLRSSDHPYTQLMAEEFDFVDRNHDSWIAHEYLAEDNHAYWRSQFIELVERFDLHYVADADYNYVDYSSATTEPARDGVNAVLYDRADLLSYRQLHSPILTLGEFSRRAVGPSEFGELFVASSLVPDPDESDSERVLLHPSGCRVEANEVSMFRALAGLSDSWPRGERVISVFPDVAGVMEDLRLLHDNRLIELRCIEPRADTAAPDALRREQSGYYTSLYHTREAIA